jgi:hypothetical protein
MASEKSILDEIMENTTFTFSINCRSAYRKKCGCWRCRESRGEKWDERTEANARRAARRIDLKHSPLWVAPRRKRK